MSPLAIAQRFAKRQQSLTAAQMAHLRQTAYRGVNTSAHQTPTTAYGKKSNLRTYRGIPYCTK